jgi:hypothetical protein
LLEPARRIEDSGAGESTLGVWPAWGAEAPEGFIDASLNQTAGEFKTLLVLRLAMLRHSPQNLFNHGMHGFHGCRTKGSIRVIRAIRGSPSGGESPVRVVDNHPNG